MDKEFMRLEGLRTMMAGRPLNGVKIERREKYENGSLYRRMLPIFMDRCQACMLVVSHLSPNLIRGFKLGLLFDIIIVF